MRISFARNCIRIAVAFFLIEFLATVLQAEEPAAAQGEDKAAVSPGEVLSLGPTTAKKAPDNLWEMIVAGGPLNLAFMAFLGLISLAAAATALERLVNLQRRKIAPPALVRGLDELVRTGEQRLERYQALCEQNPSPMASVLRAGLLRVGRPLAEIEKALEDATSREMAELRARVRPLSVAANVAPMVGLLGTVVGMLEAFRVASQAGLGKAELLAEGIYLALETTVAGLLIAIPAMLCASYFGGRNERLIREICDRMTDALPVLSQIGQRGTARPAAANPLMSS